MADLNSARIKLAAMAKLALKMWQMSFKVFMEHDLDLLAETLKLDEGLNSAEKEITADLVAFGRAANEEEKAQAMVLADVVGDLELIGDYCKDILERVEIKIEEKLLFSEEGVKEYEELFHKTESALREVVFALDKGSFEMVQEVLRSQEHIDSLVDIYRANHNRRMLDGVCSPFSCNMFLNMLDFTAAIYYHTKKISRNLLKLKK
ncbi:MAG: PhoU domain-containing protein [Candidatus Omnitrophota bacterium]|nr:PhoU domain-containing protein [Candidatus Omnitrophota bacterium]